MYIEPPGPRYRVMARGNRQKRICRDNDDRRFFLKTLTDATSVLVHPA